MTDKIKVQITCTEVTTYLTVVQMTPAQFAEYEHANDLAKNSARESDKKMAQFADTWIDPVQDWSDGAGYENVEAEICTDET